MKVTRRVSRNINQVTGIKNKIYYFITFIFCITYLAIKWYNLLMNLKYLKLYYFILLYTPLWKNLSITPWYCDQVP